MNHCPRNLIVWQLNDAAVHFAHADPGSGIAGLEPAAWAAVAGAVGPLDAREAAYQGA
jgi:hypothetical protein